MCMCIYILRCYPSHIYVYITNAHQETSEPERCLGRKSIVNLQNIKHIHNKKLVHIKFKTF